MFLIKVLQNKQKLLSPVKRQIWGYVSIAFNKVDTERLELVGPDRLCSEWIIKNGGAVRFVGSKEFQKVYNELPEDNDVQMHIKEVDATDSSIMKLGFEHFRNCRYIDKIILHKCLHMENSALGELHYVNDTLKWLQVSLCYNVSDDGLLLLKNLTKLERLVIYDLPYVKNMSKTVKELKRLMPNCKIETDAPVATE